MTRMSNDFIDLVFDTSGFDERADMVQRMFLVAAKDAVAATVKRGERRLEDAMEAVGLGKLKKAWRSQVWPKGGGIAKAPSGTIYVSEGRTEKAVAAFAFGARITPRRSEILWIPTKAAGRMVRTGGWFGPRAWESNNGTKLSPVVQPNGTILLFDDPSNAPKAVKAARRRGGQKQDKSRRRLIFVGVRVANSAQRFSIEAQTAGLDGELKAEFMKRVGVVQDLSRDATFMHLVHTQSVSRRL